MFENFEILQTLEMFDRQHLDVRTITMGISLLDCADASSARACERIYEKIVTRAERAKTSAGNTASPLSTNGSQ